MLLDPAVLNKGCRCKGGVGFLGTDDPDLQVDPGTLININNNVESGKFGPDFLLGMQAWKTPRQIYATFDDLLAGRAQMPLAYLLGVLTPAAAALVALRALSRAGDGGGSRVEYVARPRAPRSRPSLASLADKKIRRLLK